MHNNYVSSTSNIHSDLILEDLYLLGTSQAIQFCKNIAQKTSHFLQDFAGTLQNSAGDFQELRHRHFLQELAESFYRFYR